MAENNTSFDNLTHSGLIKLPSKDDKNVSMQIDTWGGTTSFVVFTGAGGKPWKHTIPARTRSTIVALINKMRNSPRAGDRQPIMLRAFVEENGKKGFKQMGQIGFGITEEMKFYVDVAHNELNGRHTFEIKPDSRFDFSQTNLEEKDMLQSLIDWFVQTFLEETRVAERLTSFKRAPNPGGGRGGGSYGGGGGNRGNYGANNSYGGGGNRQQSGGSFGSGPDIESDLII